MQYSIIKVQAPSESAAQVPTAADAFAMLEAAAGLTPTQLRDRLSALKAVVRICRTVDGNPLPADVRREAQLVPLRCATLNAKLFSRPPSALGFRERRRFDNVVSQLRWILRKLGQHAPELPTARKLAPAWGVLYAKLTQDRQMGLIAFFGWCSVHAIAPEAVRAETLDAFETWSGEHTIHRNPHGSARRVASTWNWAGQNVSGWPSVRLNRAGMSDHYAPPWSAYPASLQVDVDRFIDKLASTDEDDLAEAAFDEEGHHSRSRRRARRPRTLQTRRDCLKVALAALVANGIAPDSLTSLRDLVDPVERARTVITFHRRRTWERRVARSGGDQTAQVPLQNITSTNLFNIAETVRQVASFHCRLPQPQVARIAGWGRHVAPRKQLSMSEKNMQRLAALVEPRPYALLLNLPAKLMRQAAESDREPRTAARLAMHAVALEILTFYPMRRSNLAELRLDRHLRRANTAALIHEIFISGEEVKNGETVPSPVPVESAQLIETYLRRHRPYLAAPGNPFLFPGGGERGRRPAALSVAVKKIVEQEVGTEFNMHLMRHFAVYQFLRAFPGQYEIVRRLLGHRTVDTTRAFYAGLEARFAAEQFDAVVRQARRETRLTAEGSVGIQRRSRGGR